MSTTLRPTTLRSDHEGAEMNSFRERNGYAGDLTPEQAWSMLASSPQALLVDVRTDAEWRFVGIPDLTQLGRTVACVEWTSYPTGRDNEDFVETLTQLATPTTPLIFICRSGHRSIRAAMTATAHGFTNSYNVVEGFEGDLGDDGHRGHTGWRARGLPWMQS